MTYPSSIVSIQSFPIQSQNEQILVATIQEPRLTGECVHEVIWFTIRDAICYTPSVAFLAISLQHVTQITSQTISVLLRIQRFAKDRGIRLSLTDVSAGMREVFRILRLDGTVLTIEGTYADAVSSVATAS